MKQLTWNILLIDKSKKSMTLCIYINKKSSYLKSVFTNIRPRQVPVFLKFSMPENDKRCVSFFRGCGSFLCPMFLLSCFGECSEVSRLEWLQTGLLSHLSRALTAYWAPLNLAPSSGYTARERDTVSERESSGVCSIHVPTSHQRKNT